MMLCVWIFFAVIPAVIFAESNEFNDENELNSFLIYQILQNRELNGEITRPTKLTDLEGPYWWNDSHVGANLECDEAAKYCLTVERIVYEPTGQCHQLGKYQRCGRGMGFLELDEESCNKGKLRSVCRKISMCNNDELPMGPNQTCHGPAEVLINLCPFTKGISFHPFGGFRCEYPREIYSDPVRVIQPRTRGRCILPSLRRKFFGPFVVQCSTEEVFCLENGKLPFKNSCYTALSRDPCAERQWLVLDDREAKEGRLRVSCRSAHPCGPGEHLLHVDGTCHSEQDMRDWLCPDEHIMYHVNGDAFCKNNNRMPELRGNIFFDGICVLKILE